MVFFPQQPTLRPEDRAALQEIYDQCCGAPNACTKWKKYTPEGSQGPFLDFCSLPRQGCDGRGRLLQLNMDGWGLQCPFPAESLSKMAALIVLRMGNRHAFTGAMAPALATLGRSLEALEVLHLAGNLGMTGPLIDSTVQLPAGTAPPLCTLATTLQLLQMSGNGIEGSIPACLVSSSSSIVFLDLGMNKLTGNIPDAWDSGSPMTDAYLDGVGFGGGDVCVCVCGWLVVSDTTHTCSHTPTITHQNTESIDWWDSPQHWQHTAPTHSQCDSQQSQRCVFVVVFIGVVLHRMVCRWCPCMYTLSCTPNTHPYTPYTHPIHTPHTHSHTTHTYHTHRWH